MNNPSNNNSNSTVSHLSSALRQVNLGNSNTTTDQSNINFELSQGNNRNNDNVNINQGVHGAAPAHIQAHAQQEQQRQRLQEQQQILQQAQQQQVFSNMGPVDNSRIRKFFQNQPMEGYTLFSHRSAPNGFKVAIVLSELGLPYNTFFLDFKRPVSHYFGPITLLTKVRSAPGYFFKLLDMRQ